MAKRIDYETRLNNYVGVGIAIGAISGTALSGYIGKHLNLPPTWYNSMATGILFLSGIVGSATAGGAVGGLAELLTRKNSKK